MSERDERRDHLSNDAPGDPALVPVVVDRQKLLRLCGLGLVCDDRDDGENVNEVSGEGEIKRVHFEVRLQVRELVGYMSEGTCARTGEDVHLSSEWGVLRAT
jgi:hypothetical protein